MPPDVFPRQFAVHDEPQWNVSRFGSDRTTEGLRVQVEPRYLADHSDTEPRTDDQGVHHQPRWVWAYRVRITNVGHNAAMLVDRHWTITDAEGESHDVEGPGVVGHRPHLLPGQGFEYESFCPLPTSWGTMEGWYRFLRDPVGAEPGENFIVHIARFYLASETAVAH